MCSSDLLSTEEAAKKAKEQKYKSAISRADNAFKTKKYESARSYYQEALTIKPTESYPKGKIKEIEDKLTAIKAEEDAKAAEETVAMIKEEKYKSTIVRADKAFKGKNYKNAKSIYEQALVIKPEEAYPKEKIGEIEDKLAAIKAEEDKKAAEAATGKEKEERYKAAIAKGNKEFIARDYINAKSSYEEALTIKPNESYPKGKLKEIEDKLTVIKAEKDKAEADRKIKVENYKAAIVRADKAFSVKDYGNAKKSFEEALKIMPDESYPKGKIGEIEKILSAKKAEAAEKAAELALKKAKEEKYKATIAKADEALTANDYSNANSYYEKALEIKPAATYPREKIKGIEDKLAAIKTEADKKAAKEAAKKAKEEEYKYAINKGNKFFAIEDYTSAKKYYNNAKKIKPNEAYPIKKIKEIEDKLAAIEAEKKNVEANAIEAQYSALVTKADVAFGNKEYKNAKNLFTSSLKIKPDEDYPRDKIREIGKILATMKAEEEKKRKETEYQKALDEKYNTIIVKADKEFSERNYSAIGLYKSALSLKPDAKYPQEKIDEINAIIASNKSRDENYNAALSKGNRLFNNKDYNNAKIAFQEAVKIKPDEEYPKNKLLEIDKKLSVLKAAEDKRKREEALNTKQQEMDDLKAKQAKDARAAEEAARTRRNKMQEATLTLTPEERLRFLSELVLTYVEGVTEESFNDGNKKIIRRVVVMDGMANDYKMVLQPWGARYYFKNGLSITKSLWDVETAD